MSLALSHHGADAAPGPFMHVRRPRHACGWQRGLTGDEVMRQLLERRVQRFTQMDGEARAKLAAT